MTKPTCSCCTPKQSKNTKSDQQINTLNDNKQKERNGVINT